MRNLFKATACALALANAAYLGHELLGRAGAGKEPAPAEASPQLLRAAPAASAKPAEGQPWGCVVISGVGAAERDVAMSAFGAALGAKAYPGPAGPEAWTVESAAPYSQLSQAQAAAAALGQRAGAVFAPARQGESWTIRSAGFPSQAAASAASAKAGKGFSAKREALETYDVRFGPWPRSDMASLAATAARMGAAGAQQCNQQESQEWERSRT